MTSNARNAVARRAENVGQVQQADSAEQQQPDLASFVNSMSRELSRAVPKHLTGDRIARIALTSLRTTKHLPECTLDSFAGALMSCAQLGLEPGGPAGEAYLLPFFNRRKGVYEVQLVIGYQGMVKLFWQSPIARHLDAQAVKENDHFEYEYGLNPKLEHKPARGNRGQTIAYYAVATMTNGGSGFVVMFPEDIEEIRKRSKAKDDGPWLTDYDAMAKKTCIRQLFKTLPKSSELARAVAHDETVRTDRSLDAIDAAPEWIPGETVERPELTTGTPPEQK
ncbi:MULTISPECIES: recombinase RecT [Streptomyces]|uniref:recombinase RecT n=1 Tax=Streptomyces TaxID=1883 RepID=UPI00249E9BFE|nr:recombinase RecT [Streptomyces rochei]